MVTPTLDSLLIARWPKLDWDARAEKCGISVRGLWKLRQGLVEPRTATLRAMARALRVKPEVVRAAILAARKGK